MNTSNPSNLENVVAGLNQVKLLASEGNKSVADVLVEVLNGTQIPDSILDGASITIEFYQAIISQVFAHLEQLAAFQINVNAESVEIVRNRLEAHLNKLLAEIFQIKEYSNPYMKFGLTQCEDGHTSVTYTLVSQPDPHISDVPALAYILVSMGYALYSQVETETDEH